MRLHHVLLLVAACIIFAACSEFFAPPTATPTAVPTPTPTPLPSFGLQELQAVFGDLPKEYREVDTKSVILRNASFNDMFEHQLAFNNSTRRTSFSVSLGLLDQSSQRQFDNALEHQWNTTEPSLRETSDTRNGLFRYVAGNSSLGSRFFDHPPPDTSELREQILFRRGEIGVVVKFSQTAYVSSNAFSEGVPTLDETNTLRLLRELHCGTAYICYPNEPDFITGPQAARMIDDAIVRFYRGMPSDGDR